MAELQAKTAPKANLAKGAASKIVMLKKGSYFENKQLKIAEVGEADVPQAAADYFLKKGIARKHDGFAKK